VRECAGGLGPEAGKKRLVIETEVDDGARKLFVEAGERLLQILTNLVLNAIDVTPEGGLVRVSAMLGGDSATARFLVTDGGPGIPPAERARVFARGLSGRSGGAGIGLAHSLRVASEEGGRLELLPYESGKGAAFELVWPTAPVVSGQSPHTVRAASLGGLAIAVVDDDVSIVELLDMVLSARGATVATFTCHAELEAALEETSFHVALLDASPYGADLGESLALLKKGHPELDLVLISGAMDPGVTVDRLGVTWIRKPFDTEEVIEVVRVVRAKRRADK
jgi:CheY-like chemotaxis protein